MSETVDMSMGVYRRLYSALLHGRRINSVSEAAELLFCRLLLLADDFGNLQGDPKLIKANGFPRRTWSIRKIETTLGELLKSGHGDRSALVSKYLVGGETYLHIEGFENTQPAGKNGKRIKRYPVSPEQRIQVNPGDSQIIQCSESETEKIPKPRPKPLSIPTDDVPRESKPPPLCDAEARIRRWAGDRLSAGERLAIARAERTAEESDPVVIGGKPYPAIDLFRRALEEAIASSEGAFESGGKFMRFVGAIEARCARDGCWPGEGLERQNGHTKSSTQIVDEALAIDAARRSKP